MQTCIRPSLCHCHSLSLASVKSRLVLPFWYRLTRVVPEKWLLNGGVCVCVCACVRVRAYVCRAFSYQLTIDFWFMSYFQKKFIFIAVIIIIECRVFGDVWNVASARHEGGADSNTALSITDLPCQPVHPQVLSDTGTDSDLAVSLTVSSQLLLDGIPVNCLG